MSDLVRAPPNFAAVSSSGIMTRHLGWARMYSSKSLLSYAQLSTTSTLHIIPATDLDPFNTLERPRISLIVESNNSDRTLHITSMTRSTPYTQVTLDHRETDNLDSLYHCSILHLLVLSRVYRTYSPCFPKEPMYPQKISRIDRNHGDIQRTLSAFCQSRLHPLSCHQEE